MSDPFFKATTPDGRWAVTVEVTVDLPGEWFTGMVTLDGKIVTDTLTTDDSARLIRWARKQMADAMRRQEN